MTAARRIDDEDGDDVLSAYEDVPDIEPDIAPPYEGDPEDIRNDPRLARYKRLPENEFNALAFWASTFYPFQRDWLFEDADFAISNKARQIGTSHSTAGVGCIWGAFHGEMTTIISKGKLESQEVLQKARCHVEVLQRLGSKMAETEKSNSNEIVFASGGRILALPSTGGRSFTGNVFLDEFGYQQHAAEVWDAAGPATLLDFKVRVVSTPNGVGNEFHDLWDIATNEDRQATLDPEARKIKWVPHEIPISLAIAQGYPVNLSKCWALAKGDPRLFAQMFNCSFLDNVMQYIPSEDIEACCVDKLLAANMNDGEFYAGLDIGREVDLSCLCVIQRRGPLVWPVHFETMKRTDSAGLKAMVARAFERYNLVRLCADETGLGTFPVEEIKLAHSERIEVPHRRPRVEGITFGPVSKELLATGLYTTMSNQMVWLPASDACLPEWNAIDPKTGKPFKVNEAGTWKKLKREIASVRRVISANGNVLYTTPRTSDGHADRAWSLMLALHARTGSNPMIDALRARVDGIAPR